jgi:hypothetical protein
VQYFAGRKPMDPELREDLICEGTVGLVQGLEKYDVSRLDDTAPWSYAAHWVDLRIREAMVRLIPPVSYRNYMAWWRTGSARRLEPGESFDVARDENDELLARRIPSHQRSADDILEDAERPAEAWAELREAVPHVPVEEWDLFSLRVLHRLTPAQVAERYARTCPTGASLTSTRSRSASSDCCSSRTGRTPRRPRCCLDSASSSPRKTHPMLRPHPHRRAYAHGF